MHLESAVIFLMIINLLCSSDLIMFYINCCGYGRYHPSFVIKLPQIALTDEVRCRDAGSGRVVDCTVQIGPALLDRDVLKCDEIG